MPCSSKYPLTALKPISLEQNEQDHFSRLKSSQPGLVKPWLKNKAQVFTKSGVFGLSNPQMPRQHPEFMNAMGWMTETLHYKSHQRSFFSIKHHSFSIYNVSEYVVVFVLMRLVACSKGSGSKSDLMAFHFRPGGNKHSTFDRVCGCFWYPLYTRLKWHTLLQSAIEPGL